MWHKILVSLSVVVVLYTSILSGVEKASAVGLDTAFKIVAGSSAKQMVRGMAEKAGMKLSAKQLDNTVDYINRKSFEGDEKARQFIQGANAKTSAGAGSKPAWKKYILEPALWISGLDLVFEAVDAFNDGYSNVSPVPVYGECYRYEDLEDDFDNFKAFEFNDEIYIFASENAGYWKRNSYQAGYGYYQYENNTLGQYYTYKYDRGYVSKQGQGANVAIVTGEPTTIDENSCSRLPNVDDNYDFDSKSPSISQTTINNFDNDSYVDNVSNVTYNMEIEAPEDTSETLIRNTDTLWNTEDSTITGGTFYVVDSGGGDVIINPEEGDDDTRKGSSVDVWVVTDEEIPIHRRFFMEVQEMADQMQDMYDGTVHFMDSAVDGMQSLTTGMSGFVSFLDSFFDWLPTEYKTLLGSGFMLGVVSFFLRR